MNLELLERLRGSCPSRQSFMGFINHGQPEPASKAATPEPEITRHATADTENLDVTVYEISRTENSIETSEQAVGEQKVTQQEETVLPTDINNTDILDTPDYEVFSTEHSSETSEQTIEERKAIQKEDTVLPPNTTEVFDTPEGREANTETSNEASEKDMNEQNSNQREDAIPSTATHTVCCDAPTFDVVSNDFVPHISEYTIQEPEIIHQDATDPLFIEPFTTSRPETPGVVINFALAASELIISELETNEFTSPESLTSQNPQTPDSLDNHPEILETKIFGYFCDQPFRSQPVTLEPIIEEVMPNEHTATESTLVANETTSVEPKKPTICFDPNGDLILTIGSFPGRDMLVDSRALSRASFNLRHILSCDGKEDANGWTLELPEDDSLPFAILLNLIHTRFEKVPSHVTLDQLYGICVLTQKYNMTEVLRPVAERWYKTVGRPCEGEYEIFFKRAFVAWELGFAEDLSEMAGHVVLNCSLDEEGQLVIGKQEEKLSNFYAFQRIPIFDCIEQHRELVLETCWEECQKLSDQILKCSIEGAMCNASHSREDVCLVLGKMLSKAGEEDILDLFTSNSVYQYCQSFSLDLTTLDRKIGSVADYMDVCGWCEGIFEMMDEIRGQLHRAADPLYMNHIQAMKVQASKIMMKPWVSYDDQDE
ncbi:hypothetical protein FGRMN_2892 [Fusarium graminum]|nr:hypothetical protein FGRMN_2892 [Fusarium graminum]